MTTIKLMKNGNGHLTFFFEMDYGTLSGALNINIMQVGGVVVKSKGK